MDSKIVEIENLEKKLNFIITKGKVKKEKKPLKDKTQYTKDYFQTQLKNKKKRCEICEKEIKYNSFFNHMNNSQKHKKLIDIRMNTYENPICDEI